MSGVSSLSNVSVVSPTDGDLLFWNAANSAWQNSPLTSLFNFGFYATNSNTGLGLNIPAEDSGTFNTWLGWEAGNSQTGDFNTIIGASAQVAVADNNSTIVGANSFGSGGNLDLFGAAVQALNANTSTVIGQAAIAGSGSSKMTILGQEAGSVNNGGDYQVLVGHRAGNNLTVADGTLAANTIVGPWAQSTNACGAVSQVTNSTIVGHGAGVIGTGNADTMLGAGTKTSSSSQTLLGMNIDGGTSKNGAIALGGGITVKELNCLHLGGGNPFNLLSSTAAVAGAASALPATPAGYLVVYLNNTATRSKIPYYNN